MAVWKGDDAFHRGRRLGLLWEQSAKKAMDCSIGSLKTDMMASVHLQGGHLWQRENTNGRWRKVSRVEVPCPLADRHMVKQELERDFNDWNGWQFLPRHPDKRMPGGLGSHDMLGFFTDGGRQLGPKGSVTLEKAWIGVRNFDGKLHDKMTETATRFQKLVALPEADITGQLFSWVKFTKNCVLERGIKLLTIPMLAPEPSWDTLSGHPQRTRENKHLNVTFSKMRFFVAEDGPLEGERVATVTSFLKAIGRNSMVKHVDEHRPVWLRKFPGLTADDLAVTTLLIQSGGEGYCATKDTFRKLYPYL